MIVPFVYREKKPVSQLGAYIRCYWQFRKHFGPGKTKRIFPDSSYELIWVEKGTLYVDGERAPRLFIGGQNKKPIVLTGEGEVVLWAVRFLPWGLVPFGDVHVAANRACLPAGQCFDPEMAQELEKLFASATRHSITSKLDEYLLGHLLAKRVNALELKKAANFIMAKRGDARVQHLAEACNITRRQLERNIARATGVTPREVMSRVKFEYARNDMLLHTDVPLSIIASRHGYADQSHLIKEFQRYTDLTPVQYREQFGNIHQQIQQGYVALIQDPHIPYE